MFIRRQDPAAFTHEYDILCQRLYPWHDVVTPPFGSMWCLVEPGKTSRAHNHHEGETFFIIQGQGTLNVDGQHAEVGVGDVIYLPPFSTHALTNTSETTSILYLTVYWEDLALLAEQRLEATSRTPTRRVLVTATPPTPNGDLHLGHLSGPYTGADVFTRYLKMQDIRVAYLSGADDHQSYVLLKAEQTGQTPRKVADHFGQEILKTLAAANIDMDLFVLPSTSPYHIQLVQEFFATLYAKGKIVAKQVQSLYCASCDRDLEEAYVSGQCPHCGAGSDGNACEQCGRPNDCVDLVNPLCKHCGQTPILRPIERLYFPLSTYKQQLQDYYKTVRMSPHLMSLCDRMMADGLPDIAVSHVTDWGIPVPVSGFEDQRIYVWFEMAPGYLAATHQLNDEGKWSQTWSDAWTSEDSDVVQFFGFDNGYFHAVLFPALFLAYDSAIRLPKTFVTNEFLRLDGLKFSTSRQHAIWGQEFLAHVPADLVRFYLSYNRPEVEQTNFTIPEFTDIIQRKLVKEWQDWLHTLGVRLQAEYDGIAPEPGAWTTDQRRFYERLIQFTEDVRTAYEDTTFSLQRATYTLCELVRTARHFSASEVYLSDVAERSAERRTSMALELAAAKQLALLSAPLMPDFAARLWSDLGVDMVMQWPQILTFLPGGTRVHGLELPYFPDVAHLLAHLAVSEQPVSA